MRNSYDESAMHVGEAIKLNLMCSATVVGRTFEEEPRIDLRTPWGTLCGIPQSILNTMGIPFEPTADNIEMIRPAKRAGAETATKLKLAPKA